MDGSGIWSNGTHDNGGPGGGSSSGGVARDAIRSIIHRVLALAVEELKREGTKHHIREHLVHPMIKLAYEQAFPYIMAIVTVVVAILLISLFSLGLSAMFYFRRSM